MEVYVEDPMGCTHSIIVEPTWNIKNIIEALEETTNFEYHFCELEYEGEPISDNTLIKDTSLVGGSVLTLSLGMSKDAAQELLKKYKISEYRSTIKAGDKRLIEALAVTGTWKNYQELNIFLYILLRDGHYYISEIALQHVDVNASVAVCLRSAEGFDSVSGDLMKFCIGINSPQGVSVVINAGYSKLATSNVDLKAIQLGHVEVLRVIDQNCGKLTATPSRYYTRISKALKTDNLNMIKYCLETVNISDFVFKITSGIAKLLLCETKRTIVFSYLDSLSEWVSEPFFVRGMPKNVALEMMNRIVVTSKKQLKIVIQRYLSCGMLDIVKVLVKQLNPKDFTASFFIKLTRILVTQNANDVTEMTSITDIMKPSKEEIKECLQSNSEHPCLQAVRANRVDIVMWMFETQYIPVSVNYHFLGTSSLLIAASRHNDCILLKYLLSRGADVNYTTKDGNTALDAATACSKSLARKLLSEAGAKLGKQLR